MDHSCIVYDLSIQLLRLKLLLAPFLGWLGRRYTIARCHIHFLRSMGDVSRGSYAELSHSSVDKEDDPSQNSATSAMESIDARRTTKAYCVRFKLPLH